MKLLRLLFIISTISASVVFFIQHHAIAEDEPEKIALEPGASCITSSCHAELKEKTYLHTIGVDGMKCDICHETIEETRHVFREIPPETGPLCSRCHSEDRIAPKGLKKMPPKVIPSQQPDYVHKPFAEGKCTACHDAHGSNIPLHLKRAYPGGIYAGYSDETYRLCMKDCHKELNKMLTTPRTLSLTMFRNGNANLHFRHVNKKKGRTCSICHESHWTETPDLVKSTFEFGSRTLTISYEKTDSGGQCSTTCHRLAKYDRYKPEKNFIKTSEFPGDPATEEALEQSRKMDEKRIKEKREQMKGDDNHAEHEEK